MHCSFRNKSIIAPFFSVAGSQQQVATLSTLRHQVKREARTSHAPAKRMNVGETIDYPLRTEDRSDVSLLIQYTCLKNVHRRPPGGATVELKSDTRRIALGVAHRRRHVGQRRLGAQTKWIVKQLNECPSPSIANWWSRLNRSWSADGNGYVMHCIALAPVLPATDTTDSGEEQRKTGVPSSRICKIGSAPVDYCTRQE